ncbi:MAG: ABC transporter ATP-binding protein [Candidatus Lokiarchaeota archaeon]|nr:ABC transporter ATP-binding protein [Candidatus Lokiarchaeota archaeon]
MNKEFFPNPVIEMEKVTVMLGHNVVLKDIDLIVNNGDYLGLIGKNGSGKTTLLKTILGIYKAKSGTILVNGKPVTSKTYKEIGYVPQMHPVQREFPATVYDVVEMGLYRYGANNVNVGNGSLIVGDPVILALHKVKMERFKNRPIGHLSGGEQQKVLIAQALVRNPDILLLDEPTSALDFTMVRDLLSLLKTLNEKYEITLIVIQHNLEMLIPVCNRLVMIRGIKMYDGPPQIEKANEMIQKVFT